MPAPTTSTVSPGATAARFAAWIAQANGSSSTATSFETASGIANSCERWATIERAQPPLVSEQ